MDDTEIFLGTIKNGLVPKNTTRVVVFSFFRLGIPPFVCARGVLEGLDLHDACENEKPLKKEFTKVTYFTEKEKKKRSTLFFLNNICFCSSQNVRKQKKKM